MCFEDLPHNLRNELQWTLQDWPWTIGRETSLPVRFRVKEMCKSAIAGPFAKLRGQRPLLNVRFLRYGPRARAVAGRVSVPQRVTSGTSGLKSAQRRALVELEAAPGASLTRSEYERLTGVGRSQAAYDLAELVSAGLLVRIGGGRSTRYVLMHEPATQRRWTPDRIRGELDTFCAGRSAWPTATEFKAAGHGDLYVAASRYGGVVYWARELGLERADRSRGFPASARPPLRSRITWAFGGALGALVVAGAAGASVLAMHDFGAGGNASARRSAHSQSAGRVVDRPFPSRRSASTGSVSAPVPSRARHHVGRQTTRPAPRVRLTAPAGTTHVSSSLYTASARTAPAVRKTYASAAAHGGGPAPLPAPIGASAPSPLRAP